MVAVNTLVHWHHDCSWHVGIIVLMIQLMLTQTVTELGSDSLKLIITHVGNTLLHLQRLLLEFSEEEHGDGEEDDEHADDKHDDDDNVVECVSENALGAVDVITSAADDILFLQPRWWRRRGDVKQRRVLQVTAVV